MSKAGSMKHHEPRVRFVPDADPFEYTIEPAERFGWWVRVGHGIYSQAPEHRFTLAGAHQYGRIRVAKEEKKRLRRIAKRGMLS